MALVPRLVPWPVRRGEPGDSIEERLPASVPGQSLVGYHTRGAPPTCRATGGTGWIVWSRSCSSIGQPRLLAVRLALRLPCRCG